MAYVQFKVEIRIHTQGNKCRLVFEGHKDIVLTLVLHNCSLNPRSPKVSHDRKAPLTKSIQTF